MSKNHPSPADDNSKTSNEAFQTSPQTSPAGSPELAPDTEPDGVARRMRAEVKIGLSVLGLLLAVFVCVLVYRLWWMKADEDQRSAAHATVDETRNQNSASAPSAAPAPSISSTTNDPAESGTETAPGAPAWNVDYPSNGADPGSSAGSPVWPTQEQPPKSAPGSSPHWAEVGIGQTMLPESASRATPGDSSTVPEDLPQPPPYLASDRPEEAAPSQEPWPQTQRDVTTQSPNAASGNVPFGPWNPVAEAGVNANGQQAVGSPPLADSTLAPTPASTSPPDIGDSQGGSAISAVPQDFFAGGSPITRSEITSPQSAPTPANAFTSNGPYASERSPAGQSLNDSPASPGQSDGGAPALPFAETGSATVPADRVSADTVPSSSGGFRQATPAQIVGNPPPGESPMPQIPPLAAGNAATTAGITYTVREGESLFDIARGQLGKASRWVEIYDLNRTRLGSRMEGFRPGITLILPQPEAAASLPSPQLFR